MARTWDLKWLRGGQFNKVVFGGILFLAVVAVVVATLLFRNAGPRFESPALITPFVTPELLSSPLSPSVSVAPLVTLRPTPFATPLPRPTVAGVHVYVSTTGKDEAAHGSEALPWRTIQYALSKATPGTTIMVKAGEYKEYLTTTRSGAAGKPITLKAEGVVRLVGDGDEGRVLQVLHDYYVIEGFDISQSDILLWLQRARHNRIVNNYFHHAQGECVRIKYHSSSNVFAGNRVEYCGREDYGGGGDGKNGEGVYIGTAPEQLNKNPTSERDGSNANLISGNTFNTRGNECVDIKEGSSKNVVEKNSCTGQRDPESGGFSSRGNSNTFRANKSFNNTGAGIRFGGDSDTDGLHNEAYGNELYGNEVAIKVTRLPQGKICGNIVRDNRAGFSNKEEIKNLGCS